MDKHKKVDVWDFHLNGQHIFGGDGVPIWRNTEIGLCLKGILKNCIHFGGFGKQKYCRSRKFCISKEGTRQSSNPTDTDVA